MRGLPSLRPELPTAPSGQLRCSLAINVFTHRSHLDELSVSRKLGRARFWDAGHFPITRLYDN